ncbi:hypothetical protein [Sinomonas mesophila]|uniref:hypothetical protein n=1 Tax=Sinomonas mesophila TaxID=1531955 RepID=UPI000986E553|nr:hypothetical protein [Sinomonas mesophila]
MSLLLRPAPTHPIPSLPVVLRREDRVAVTGGHCPTSGAWAPESQFSAPVILRRGELMPPHDGLAVEWHYTALAAPDSAQPGH